MARQYSQSRAARHVQSASESHVRDIQSVETLFATDVCPRYSIFARIINPTGKIGLTEIQAIDLRERVSGAGNRR